MTFVIPLKKSGKNVKFPFRLLLFILLLTTVFAIDFDIDINIDILPLTLLLLLTLLLPLPLCYCYPFRAYKLLISVTKLMMVTVLSGMIIAATRGDKFPVTA